MIEASVAFIEEALEHAGGTHTLEDVLQGILEGQYQFWPGERSACVTEIVQHPRKKVFVFWLMGGDLVEAMERIEPQARAWAETQGCTMFLGNAIDRPGWERALAKYGYAPGWRVFRRI